MKHVDRKRTENRTVSGRELGFYLLEPNMTRQLREHGGNVATHDKSLGNYLTLKMYFVSDKTLTFTITSHFMGNTLLELPYYFMAYIQLFFFIHFDMMASS